MYTLLTFAAGFDEPSHSPFCVKAMCLLQMAGAPWQRQDLPNPGEMPYGRFPVLQSGDQLIPDSSFIQAHLEAQGAEFNTGLSQEDQARSHMLIRMVEESLRLSLVCERWLNDECWKIVWPEFFSQAPEPVRQELANGIRESVRAGLMSHGMAQFSEADRLRRVAADLDSLAGQLGDKAFLFSDAATAADAATVPVLSMLMNLPADTALRQLLRSYPTLVDYVARGRAAIYPPLA